MDFNVLHLGHRNIRKKNHKRRINKATIINSAIISPPHLYFFSN